MSENNRILRLARKAVKDPDAIIDLFYALDDLFKAGKLSDTRLTKLVENTKNHEVFCTLLDAVDEAALTRFFSHKDDMGQEAQGEVTFLAVPVYGALQDIDAWLEDPSTGKTIISFLNKADNFSEYKSFIVFPGSYDPYMISGVSHSELYRLTGLLDDVFMEEGKNEESLRELIDIIFSLRMPPVEEDIMGVRIALVGALSIIPLDAIRNDHESECFIENWMDAIAPLKNVHPHFALDVPIRLVDAHNSAFEIRTVQWESLTKAKTIIIHLNESNRTLSLIAGDGHMEGQSFDIDPEILRQHFEESVIQLLEDKPLKYTMSGLTELEMDEGSGSYFN